MNKNISQKLLQRVIDVAEDAYNQGYNKGYNDGFKDGRKDVLDTIGKEIEQNKQYKGKSGNLWIDAHNVGLDEYFDLGLDKALKIIDKYKAESEGKDAYNR